MIGIALNAEQLAITAKAIFVELVKMHVCYFETACDYGSTRTISYGPSITNLAGKLPVNTALASSI
jgi:hypothetical protein